MKKISLSATLMALGVIVALASVELSRSNGTELFLKIWAFISLLLIDIYVLISVLQSINKD